MRLFNPLRAIQSFTQSVAQRISSVTERVFHRPEPPPFVETVVPSAPVESTSWYDDAPSYSWDDPADIGEPQVLVDVDFDDRIVGEILNRVSLSELALDDVVEIIHDGIRENFANEGSARGPWPQLADETVRQRRWLGVGGEHPILQRGLGGPDGRVLLEALTSPDSVQIDDHILEVTYPTPGDARFRRLSVDRPMLALGPVYEDEIRRALVAAILGRSR